jgi:hypothetical protein
MKGFGLLFVGSPTHGGFPTKRIHALLQAPLALKRIGAAAFDTRTRTTIFGYAATKIARDLQRHGARLLAPAEGFLVAGIRGPLKEGELARAAA